MSSNLRSPLKQPPCNAEALLFRHNALRRVEEVRLGRRRRIKTSTTSTSTTAAPMLAIRSQFGNFITDFISQFPAVDIIAPALGFASGVGLNMYKDSNKRKYKDDAGEWILFTTPSPFTRFVLLRCPSLSFPGIEKLEDVNDKLVKENRHLVRFDCSRISDAEKASELVGRLKYQRLCVPTDEGGVISLDLPANLNLGEENGLDTTLLLVPGTTEGSMDKDVQMFVSESLNRGCFPVVLNPRGCAGSPLTTPRIFTAGDSDDVCKAVQFISEMRPLTTIMGVGWGYGANMLTKYLAEVGDKTPLTAATCINNPFDLEEVLRISPQQLSIDRKLLDGLKDILRSNKEIFHGRTKGFDVEKALLAESVREFESIISVLSYGFQTIQDFYSACSTEYAVRGIKIPVLFIQSDSETLPVYSAPRSLIAENPCTSLLVCSSPSDMVAGSGTAVSWCQYLTVEWLTAVEIGLMKGHRPLLEYVDVSLRLLDDGQKQLSNEYSMEPTSEMLDQKAVTSTVISRPGIGSQIYSGHENMKMQQMNSAKSGDENSVNVDSVKENEGSAAEIDKGQVLQTAQLALNMLEVAMPGTLPPEQKEKVLTAVSQGETVLKALQDAIPEDASEKLTTTVSEISNTVKNLKLDGVLNISQNSKVLSGSEKVGETSNLNVSSSRNSIDEDVDPEHELDATLLGNKPRAEANDIKHTSEEENDVQSQSVDNHVDQDADSVPEGLVDSVSVHNGTPAYSDEKEVNVNGDLTSSPESVLGNKEPIVDQYQGNEDHETPQFAAKKETDTQNIEKKSKDSSADPNKIEPPAESHQAVSSSKSDPVCDATEKIEEKGTQLVPDNRKTDLSNPAPPSIHLSEAFDTLTGMDDSTQTAVNSVFGVMEDMITQLEEKTDNEKEIKDIQDVVDEKPHHAITNNCNIEDEGDYNNQQNAEIQDSSTSAYPGDSLESPHTVMNELVDERMVKGSSLAEDISGCNNEHLVNKEKDNDQAGNNNPSCSSPHTVESPHYDIESEKHMNTATMLDMNTATSPCLDYSPDESQLKHLEQPGISEDTDNSTERPKKHVEGHDMENDSREDAETKIEKIHDLNLLVKSIIMDSLEAEVLHRVSEKDMKAISHNLAKDLELVSNVISQAVIEDTVATWSSTGRCLNNDNSSMTCSNLRAEHIVKAVSFTDQEAQYLRRILPVGVIVGSSLAALKKYFNLISRHDSAQGETLNNSKLKSGKMEANVKETKNGMEFHQPSASKGLGASEKNHAEENSFQNGSSMVGAVTAAVGASALLMQDSYAEEESSATVIKSMKNKEYKDKEPKKLGDEIAETQKNLVTSIGEKAMSVAGPMVPMKEDGAVDQERVITMLTNLGQNGGMLKLVGKAALLWGGMRGAMNLTHKLISFLHLSKRPLFHRLVGFVGMVILLWSPVCIPLLPTLVRGWTTKSPSKAAELCCIIGLYVAVTVLIMLWGKRIRGYERPLQQYGLDFKLPELKSLMKAYIGGALIVLSVQYVNTVIGCASISWQTCLPLLSFSWLPEFGKFLLLVAQGTISATGVVLVEELLFRSWLPAEISKEFGFHLGIIVAGFTFAILQWSLNAIPGLWLLSLALAGAKERSKGSLSTPIGLRAGIMATTFVLQKGTLLTYHSKVPLWIWGTHPVQPFSGISGLALSLLLAVCLYPRQPNDGKIAARKIRE
ncbi:unnamed protein product [Rhodiola kirilowii]